MTEAPLRLVIVGHIDHGKSTLVGRLCYETGALPEGALATLEASCARRGVPFSWAFVMDALQVERAQGITLDASQRWLRTSARGYVIIDAPGHRALLKNMLTGAASASAALLVVAADEGAQAQSRRHAVLLSMLGVTQVIVVVNKMDQVGYQARVFEQLERELGAFLAKLHIAPRAFIPVVASQGDNLARLSPVMPWYQGPTLLALLDALRAPVPPVAWPLRLPIQDVYLRDGQPVLVGNIATGTLRCDDALIFCPSGQRARVTSLVRWPEPAPAQASAGDAIGLTLDAPIFDARGQLATLADDALQRADQLLATLFWMGARPLERGRDYRLCLTTQEVTCQLTELLVTLDTETLAEHTGAVQLWREEIGRASLQLAAPLAIDLSPELPALHRFVLMDEGEVVGGGLIVSATWRE